MSMAKTISFNCPDCSAPMSVTVYESVNTALTEDLPEKIITGEFFKKKCLGCGKIHRVVHSMLYNDLRHKAWIFMALPSDKDHDKNVSNLHSTPLPLNVESRLVFSPEELAEKVSILEAGRDDRIIEFFKVSVIAEMQRSHPEVPLDSITVRYVWENPGEYFIIYSGNNEVYRADFDEGLYKKLAKAYSLCDNTEGPFFVCDINWALDHATALAEKFDAPSIESEAPAESKSNDEVNFCRKCGKKIPSDSEFCSYCGIPVVRANASESITVSESKKAKKAEKVKKPKKEKVKKSKPEKQPKQKKARTPMPPFARSLLALAFLFLIAFGIAHYFATYVMSTPSSNSTSNSTTTTTRKLVPVSVKNGEIIKAPSNPRLVEFEVSVPFGNDYYIYMEGKSSGDTMSFYVKSGETVVVDVPIGKYTVFYAVGDTWYGSRYLFGDDTEYFKCDDTFEFTSEYGWSLTLYSVYNGNLDTDSIDADDFPE